MPKEVILRVLIPETFPMEPVEFYLENVSAFPHQDAKTGKLCLREEALAPVNASRLVCYVKWALEWLKDAANDRLLQSSKPYDLPDFSRKLLNSRLPTSVPLSLRNRQIPMENGNLASTRTVVLNAFGGTEFRRYSL